MGGKSVRIVLFPCFAFWRTFVCYDYFHHFSQNQYKKVVILHAHTGYCNPSAMFCLSKVSSPLRMPILSRSVLVLLFSNEPQLIYWYISHIVPLWKHTRDENVENNEGLGRKSSKRCCIFHKQRPFGESSTDSSDEDSVGSGSSSSSGGPSKNNRRKIARPKRKKVPDFQRYHA